MPSTTDLQPLIPLAEQRLARSALRRLLKSTSDGKGRLLYLVGPAGCGKSALLAESFRELPSSQVPPLQLTAAEFAAQLAEASSNQQVPNFQERFRSVSVLVCEDIQGIERRPETQRQLLAAIDELLAHGSDVVVTSTKLPGQLESFPAKLVSRFRGGIIVSLKLPGPESRTELLRLFCRQRRLSISRDALALLAELLEVSQRELIGVVTQLSELHRSLKRADIEEFLRNKLPTKSITPLTVARAVAREFGITLPAMRSSRRSQALVLPRQCAMWLCRKLCHASYPELGEFFARQHSSVIHAVRKLEARLDKEPALRQRLTRLEGVCR
ncbi:MAG: AAA family ATPase [Planctomycetaceae bacterium]|nr:AAA family ATPase [Planctomycetaceae bacterium]